MTVHIDVSAKDLEKEIETARAALSTWPISVPSALAELKLRDAAGRLAAGILREEVMLDISVAAKESDGELTLRAKTVAAENIRQRSIELSMRNLDLLDNKITTLDRKIEWIHDHGGDSTELRLLAAHRNRLFAKRKLVRAGVA